MNFQKNKEILSQKKFYNFISKPERKNKGNEFTKRIRLNSEFCKTGFYLFSEEQNVYFIIENEKKSLHLKNIPNIKGLSIKNKKPKNTKTIIKYAIGIYCEDKDNKDIYFKFIYHLINDIGNIDKALEVRSKLIQLLKTYLEFYDYKKKPLSSKKQLGLIGELFMLRKVLVKDNSISKSLKKWTGPYNDIHDFYMDKYNIEVKTSSKIDGRQFIINGETQLDDIKGKILFLVNPVFIRDEIGNNLNDFIEDINKLIIKSNDKKLFYSILNLAGFYENHKDYYKEKGIKVSFKKIFIYEVKEGFPRVTPNLIDEAVEIKEYIIAASACKNFLIKNSNTVYEY